MYEYGEPNYERSVKHSKDYYGIFPIVSGS